MQNRPNFFIVGAAKSGTTSLAKYLEQHPDIFLSPVKEPFFYVSDHPDSGFKDLGTYLSLFRSAGKAKWIGEASTGYLFEPTTAKTLARDYPSAKIIIILRNPVDMVVSYWNYMKLAGNEAMSLEEAISPQERDYRKTDDFKKSCQGWWAGYLYLERASYSQQIERYLNVFPREQIKFMLFEDFVSDPVSGCKDVFQFFGVDATFTPKIKIHNAGGGKRFNFLTIHPGNYLLLRKILKPFFSNKNRENIRTFIRRINTKKTTRPRVSKDTYNFLENFFKEEIEKVKKITGLDLSVWRKDTVHNADKVIRQN